MVLVSKSDTQSLAGKNKKALVAEADVLKTGQEFLLELKEKARITPQEYTDILGLFRVRCGGFLTRKSQKIL